MFSQSPQPESTELIALRQRNRQLERQLEELRQVNLTLLAELETLKQTGNSYQQDLPNQTNQDEQEVTEKTQQTQEQLKRQEQFLRSVYNGVAHSIFVIDVLENNEFRFVGWNSSTEQATGISSAQVAGKTPEEVFGDIQGAEIKQNYHKCCKAKTGITYEECRVLQLQKTWWLTTLHPLKNSEDHIYRLVGTTFNIDERKQAEYALQESQERYRSLYTNTPVMMHSINQQGCIDRVSNYWLTHLGYSLSEVLGQPSTKFLTEASQQYAKEVVMPKFFQTGACKDVPYQFVKKNGEVVDVLLSAISETDDSGQIVRSLAVLIDVTEQKQIAEALRQEQEFTHVVVESVSDGVVACDKTGNLKLFNRAAREWHGCDPRTVSPQDWANLYNLYEGDGVTPLKTEQIPLLRAFQGESVRRAEMAIVAKGQAPRYILASGDPLFDSHGQRIGAVAAMHDITERKQAEKALKQSEAQLRQQAQNLENALQELQRTQTHLIQSEKMSSLGQLVAGVAHEINNPVSFIYGNLSHAHIYTQDLLHLIRLYQKHYPEPTAEIQAEIENIDLDFLMKDLPKLLSSMHVGAERIQKIVASLRNFSRMDEAELKEVDIHDGIDSTLMILQNRLKAYNDRPEIQVIKSYGKLPFVRCYAGQLNQVFMNILSNAIDALEEKLEVKYQKSRNPDLNTLITLDFAPIISIRTEMTSPNQVTIRIADNGPGIPEKAQQRLFDPFFTTKAVGKGTGMGLSISYQIVTERHKGSMYCFSSPAQGAEFVVEIPVQ